MTITHLKIIALIAMLIDHVGEFIPNMPEYFRWIGRISAPIFIFCTSYGFFYTRNKIIYLARLYAMGICMSVINLLLFFYVDHTYFIDNNIFPTLFVMCLIIHLFTIGKKDKRYNKLLFLFIGEQIISTMLLFICDNYVVKIPILQFISDLTANVFFVEGGIVFVALGLIFYYCNHKQINIVIPYISFSFVYTVLYSTSIIPRIFLKIDGAIPNYVFQTLRFIFGLFRTNVFPVYQTRFYMPINYLWMVIFALPFILLYNGKKGKGYKYLFYLFYPLHIYILYIVRYILSH